MVYEPSHKWAWQLCNSFTEKFFGIYRVDLQNVTVNHRVILLTLCHRGIARPGNSNLEDNSMLWSILVHDSWECGTTHESVAQLMRVWHNSRECGTTHESVAQLTRVWHNSRECGTTHESVAQLTRVWHNSRECDTTHESVAQLMRVWHNS